MGVYKLSATLAAHSADVKSVCAPTPDLVLSGSRDATAISWQRTSPSSFTQSALYKGGSKYVNSVAYLPPSGPSSQGYLVAGGQDTVVNVFSLASDDPEPTYSLIGHRENVCTLHTTNDGVIISGSWDKTAIVWQSYQQKYILSGHSQAVWSVLALDATQFLTGSADKTIKLWNAQNQVRTFSGHGDAVRALAAVPDIGFASASNDSTIRVWTMMGDVVYNLSGHTSFIYTLALLPSGEIVSGGEDRTVRIWRDGESVQTIVHPAISVWGVATSPNGDIVTGCSDGVVRVFSAAEDRWAAEPDLKAYDQQVAKQALPSQQIGDVNKADLPGMEALARPGRKDGQTIMIRNASGVVEAYQWESANRTWQQIGEVVDAIGSSRKQLYKGKEYDYVFDVEIQPGAPPLKLPFNASDNPYVAAQQFLADNDLPGSHLDEVVRFIDKNTGGVNIGPQGEQYTDPWTGASRWRPPTGSSAQTPSTSTSSDPWTGSSRYVPSTGSSVPKILPVRTPLSFKQANVTAMRTKLHQLNQSLESEISMEALSLSPQETKAIERAFTILNNPSPADTVSAEEFDLILQTAARWPESDLFPVIDLIRLILASTPSVTPSPITLLQTLAKATEWDQPWNPPPSKARETNILLTLRAFANALQSPDKASEWVPELLAILTKPPYGAFAKTQRVPLATITLNASCHLLQSNNSLENIRGPLLSLILEVLQKEDKDGEAVYRALVALGNSLFSKPKYAAEVGLIGDVKAAVNGAAQRFNEARVKAVATDILGLGL